MMMGVSSNHSQMYHKQMLRDLGAHDVDGKRGLSLEELKNYEISQERKGYEVSEFAHKLSERFSQLDVNHDGQLNTLEVNSLQNNRGLWQVKSFAAVSTKNTVPIAGGATSNAVPPDASNNNTLMKSLLKQGYDKFKDQIDIKGIVDKVL